MRGLKTVGYLLVMAAAGVYVLNPGAGVFELLPDNLPLIGNLDEAGMGALLLYCIRGLRKLREDKRLDAAQPAS
jgi:uncharacterized membrane protein YkvA (DUF1232 family)